MIYFFCCPLCGVGLKQEWGHCGSFAECPTCIRSFIVPSPKEQPKAYVDTHEWPVLMEEQVYAEKGEMCTVPGCGKRAETLDHRVPYSKGGKTSFENLWPMCEHHNLSKGDEDYADWLVMERVFG